MIQFHSSTFIWLFLPLLIVNFVLTCVAVSLRILSRVMKPLLKMPYPKLNLGNTWEPAEPLQLVFVCDYLNITYSFGISSRTSLSSTKQWPKINTSFTHCTKTFQITLCENQWQHELGILAAKPDGATIGGKVMVDWIPQSAELRDLLTEKNQWQAEQRKR